VVNFGDGKSISAKVAAVKMLLRGADARLQRQRALLQVGGTTAPRSLRQRAAAARWGGEMPDFATEPHDHAVAEVPRPPSFSPRGITLRFENSPASAAVAATVAMQANAPAAIALRWIITGCLYKSPNESIIALAHRAGYSFSANFCRKTIPPGCRQRSRQKFAPISHAGTSTRLKR
jgi:hypothetical protein